MHMQAVFCVAIMSMHAWKSRNIYGKNVAKNMHSYIQAVYYVALTSPEVHEDCTQGVT